MHDVGEVVVITHCINRERQQVIEIYDTAFALE